MRLKDLRRDRNETQEQIADLIGVTRGAYANIENGKREPDFEALFTLADHFGVSIDYLLEHQIIKGGNDMPQEKKVSFDDLHIIKQIKKYCTEEGYKFQPVRTFFNTHEDEKAKLLQSGNIPVSAIPAMQKFLGPNFLENLPELDDESEKAPSTQEMVGSVPGLSPSESCVIDAYRRASADDRQIIDNIVRRYSPSEKEAM